MIKSEVQDLWDQSLQILQKKINKYSFETLLKSLKPLGCHENTIIIEAPSYFTRDWLSDRYAPLIKEVFQNILNKDIDVKFLISSEISDIASSNKKQNDKNTDDLSSTHFNPKYSFKNFVIGNSNRFAHAACLAVAESPSKTYNPLFIYGGAGLGKTHLMQAIGWFILENHNRMKVSYVTSEKFTNELINSIRDYNTNDFRNKYRNMDILLVDDIQFLAGKESTQEEFFHTFNSLYEDNRQIIISSDRPPKEIPTLEDRLRSRFEWGLITDIQPPDLETRIAILRKKGQLENLQVPDDTISYIADKIQSNIRVLEGALIKVIAYASLYNEEITPELAAKVLKDILPPEKPTEITVELIQQVVSSYYNLRQEDFKAKRRTTAISFPRQIAMYLTKELTDLSLPKIGDFFGGRDHTTVLHACNKISNKLQEDYTLQNVIAELVKKIKNS
ncbi:MAG: Chromosomal replication initiator protein DnaA [Pelotomaculum sp. PtaB.Bin117]|nr:MAG: Chromosomal replication initiator protein DnaA [Pelotomaculum sp. PtaB.Bin117]OPY60100.1 MAG: Chromosomal replication initiator protein DnaA [Pelotomaculum sp. PtaU1.Bin065]